MSKINPDYYSCDDGMDVIDMIGMLFGREIQIGFCIGNIIKYVKRYKDKNGLEDLEKARVYLDRLYTIEKDGN